ncbi:uncharacterized protein AB675_1019 [Cyphellophora attinorum]|uniref:Heterokaryon incompatibility domain-containing protein n=1 Tax=Cyphellophora attinorum TaxID=1664694 RepID=A0A0N0NKT7_9EURO|nr:uncharacterized protein AB675_1019 [Phialophora attinorum]KPI38219.1 hypothetical protein AB675_1019 [Phialophora attinorum]
MTTSISRQPYEYSGVDKDAREIRVLDLFPKLTSDGMIQGRLRTITLSPVSDDHVLDYRALSYAWGNPEQDQHQIVVDGKRLEVRANLHDFLQVYRKDITKWTRRMKHRTLWIDTICINQANVHERNHQVWMMSDIYKRAEEVVTWLGRGIELASGWDLRLFRLLATVHSPLTMLNRSSTELLSSNTFIRRLFRSTALMQRLARLPLNRMCGRSYHHLLKRSMRSATIESVLAAPYFDRRWVYGEMLLARKKTIYVGTIRISWPIVMLLWDYADNDDLNYIDVLDKLTLRGTALETALNYYRRTRCQETHDYVYAFLGFCNNGSSFPISYDCSLIELLLGTALFCLSNPLNLSDGMAYLMSPDFSKVFERLAELWMLHEQIACGPMTEAVSIGRRLACYTAQDCFSHPSETDFLIDGSHFSSVSRYEYVMTYDLFFDITESGANVVTSYFDQVLAAAGATHVVTCHRDKSVTMVLLSRCEGPCCQSRCFKILGRLHGRREYTSLAKQPLERPDHASDAHKFTCATEIYGPKGLPGIHLRRSSNHIGKPNLVVSELRSAVIVFGLPGWTGYRNLRLSALDILYDPMSFAIEPIMFEEVEFRGTFEGSGDSDSDDTGDSSSSMKLVSMERTSFWQKKGVPPGSDRSTLEEEESDDQVSFKTTESACLSNL